MTDRVKTVAAGRDLCTTPAERRDLLRLLRRLLRGPVEMGAGEGAALRVEGEDLSLAADLVARAVRHGLVAASGGTLSATPQTSAFLRRAMLAGEEAFAGQHRVEVQETVDVEGERQAVRRNLAESPLALLSRLKDRTGGAFLPAEAIEAGERLAADFTRAQLQPRVTASWEPRLSARGKGERGGQAELADSAMAARDRFAQAVEAMGPELAGVAIDVCCFCKGLETVERERQWPARSAKLMLRTALLALARHYAPPPRQSCRASHHWGADGYRPPMPR